MQSIQKQTLIPNPINWCKIQAVDFTSFAIISSVIFIQCMLMCLLLRSLTIRARHHMKISPEQLSIFRFMGAWFVTNKMSMSDHRQSCLFSATFLIRWGHSVCMQFQYASRVSGKHGLQLRVKNTIMSLKDQQLSFQESKRVDKVFLILKIMKNYLKYRNLIVLINLAFSIYMIIDPDIGKYANYLTVITMFQASIAIFVYTFGILSLQKFKELLGLPLQIKRRILIQYALLTICCLSRLVFNFLYYFDFSTHGYLPFGNCHNSLSTSFIVYIYLSLGYTIMHLMPISTIILIYWPDVQKSELRISILSAPGFAQIKSKILNSHKSINFLLGSGQVQKNDFISHVQQDLQQQQRNQSPNVRSIF